MLSCATLWMNGSDCTKPRAGLFPNRHRFRKSKRLFEPVERQISSSSVMGWLVPTEAQRESIARALGGSRPNAHVESEARRDCPKREIRAGGTELRKFVLGGKQRYW